MTLKQISLETKLKLINFKSPNKFDDLIENKVSSEMHSPILFNSNLNLLTDPSNYSNSILEIERLNLNFVNLTKSNKYNFVQICSDELFHLKIDNCFIITTKLFNYFNYEKCICLSVANGTLRLNETNNLVLLNSTKNISVNYFLGYFENNKYLNINWENTNGS